MADSSSKKFYITTTLPYVNAEPHLGFAMEIIRADTIARYKKLQGFDVFFNTGTDEHGAKIFKKSQEEGRSAQEYVNEYAEKFKALIPLLNISRDVAFTRTTDEHHVKAAQEFWKLCDKNGYIYKKNYQIKYCVGCELEKSDSELVDGKCPIHPNLEIELIDEENYFFKFSAFQEKLQKLYKDKPDFVIPSHRMNEITSLVDRGLNDFSISRLKSKMSWGIPVPGDSEQVMYVWFDALVNYISAIGWPTDMEKFNAWHNEKEGMIQYCGKDNLRQQAAMWQAMLMAAGLPNSKHIIVNGFITGAGGIKMSKSLGNTIAPADIVSEYGTDALRYYLLREVSPFEDSPFTMEMFKDAYNANLANGLGNLVSRVMTLSEKYINTRVVELIVEDVQKRGLNLSIKNEFDNFHIQLACIMIWNGISKLDKKIAEEQPFKVVKVDREKAERMFGQEPVDDQRKNIGYLWDLATIAYELEPILPDTSRKIIEIMKSNKKPETPLFVRKD